MLADLLEREEMTLIVSLPYNSVDLAKAALAGGAESLKVHIHVKDTASRTSFGSLTEERKNLEGILKASRKTPIGVVAGGETPVTPDEFNTLVSMGFDYVDLHAHHIPAWMWLDERISRVVAIDETYISDEVIALNLLSPDAVEAAIIPESGYGAPLTVRDLSRYQMIYDIVDWPMIVPTQRNIHADEAVALQRIGVNAIMINAVVAGTDTKTIETTTARFRRALRGA